MTGHKASLWLFMGLTVLTILRSVVHITGIDSSWDSGAQTIAGIQLDSWSPSEARTSFIALFAQWGWSQLLMALVYALACLRYRAMVPLLYVAFILDFGGRHLISRAGKRVAVNDAPGEKGPLLALVAIVGLIGSLWPQTGSRRHSRQ